MKMKIILVNLLLLSLPSFAYLDMGTGSYILQSLLAGFFAVVYFVKIYWFKLSAFISKIFKKKNSHN